MTYQRPIVNPFEVLFPKTTNFVRFVFAQECDATFWVYAEAFFPAALKLALATTVPDINDLIRGRGEAIVDQSRAVSRKRGGKFRRGAMVTFDAPQERYASRGLAFLLRVTEPIEKIGFRWLLYSATEDFFQDWQTLIIRSGACGTLPERGPLTRRTTGQRESMLPGGNPIALPIVDVNRSGWSTDLLGASLPDGQYMCLITCTFLAPTGGIEGAFVQLRTDIVGIEQTQKGPENGGEAGQPVDIMGKFFFRIPSLLSGSIVWEIGGPAVPVGVEVTKAFMSVQRIDGSI